MSVYVSSGGSGSVLTSVGAHGTSVETTLLTTPNVANTMFLISWQLSHDENIVETTNCVEQSPMQGTMKVGPNVAAKVRITNQSDTAEQFCVAYQYVGLVIDTN